MKWIFNNIALKIGALLIAILLWFHVVTEKVVYETVEAPIRYQNLPDTLVIVGTSADAISFQIKTKVKQLILLNLFGHPFTRINLEKVKKGKNQIEPSVNWLVLPSWRPLDIIGVISPEEVSVETEKKNSKKIAVIATIVGTPEKGYFLKEITINPDSVNLNGGKKRLRKINEIGTDTIDVSKRTMGLEVDASLIMPGKGFSSKTEKVKVNIVFEKCEKKTLYGVNIILKGKENYEVYPESLNVTVTGPEEILDKITATDIEAFVDIKGFQVQAVPFFNLPKGVVLESYEPQKVKVRTKGKEAGNDKHKT